MKRKNAMKQIKKYQAFEKRLDDIREEKNISHDEYLKILYRIRKKDIDNFLILQDEFNTYLKNINYFDAKDFDELGEKMREVLEVEEYLVYNLPFEKMLTTSQKLFNAFLEDDNDV